MRKQDQLQQLIHGLSANEKRYFKIFSSLKTGEKNYLKLFDQLGAYEQYDAQTIGTKIDKSKAALAHSKEHLKDVLLRALRSFNEDTFASSYYHRQLEEIELLYSKEQLAWTFSKIEKTLNEALKEDAFQYVLMLLRWYHTVGFYVGKGSYMPEQINLEQKTLTALGNELQYQHLLYRFNHLLNEQKEMVNSKTGNELKELMRSPMLTNSKKPLSNSARILFHRINGMYYLYVSLNKTKSEKHFIEALKIFKNNPLLFRAKARVYCMMASGLINVYNSFEEYGKASKAIDDFEHTLATQKYFSKPNLVFGWNHVMLTRIYNLCYSNQYKKAIEYAEHVQQQQHSIYKQLSVPNRTDFLFMTAISYWKTKGLKHALKISEQLIRTETTTNNITLVNNRFLFLLIQFDLGHYTTLQYLLQNHIRWCRKEKLTGKKIILFNKMLQELCRTNDYKKHRMEVFKKYLPSFKNSEQSIEQRIFDTLEIADWIKEKTR